VVCACVCRVLCCGSGVHNARVSLCV
jgi:hypothetical protein